MIDTARGGNPMHEDCEFSRLTRHWNCCPVYDTLDESDCTCYDDHN